MRRGGKYIIRGRPGSGKSTAAMIVKRKLEELGIKVGGIRTPEVRFKGRRLGFEVENLLTGERALFASIDYEGGPRVSRYGIRLDVFEKIAIPALVDAVRNCDVIVVDEIGKMELLSPEFVKRVREIWLSERAALGTAPISKIRFIEEISSLSEVILIKRGEASEVADELTERIVSYLGIR